MAERRMFSKQITDGDAFTEMPATAQALYLHLCMSADDDGFTNKVRQALFDAHADKKDLDLLIRKRFLISFGNVVVIKHWCINNWIRKDRHQNTKYTEYADTLRIKENGAYTERATDKRQKNGRQVTTTCQPGVNQVSTECQTDDNQVSTECQPLVNLDKYSIDKGSIDKGSIDKDTDAAEPPCTSEKPIKHKYGVYDHVLLSDKEFETLVNDYGMNETGEAIGYLDEYIEMKGTKYKSHYLALRKWVFDAVKERKKKATTQTTIKPTPFNDISTLKKDSGGFNNVVEAMQKAGVI